MKTAEEKTATPRRWRALCSYDGSDFDGWQSQVSGRAIQDFIERRLSEVLKTPTRIHASGRTDAGVHARAQPFHFDAVWPHGAETFLRALSVGLPAGIQITSLRAARKDFHARFSATGKRYVYFIDQGRADPFEAPFCWSLKRPLDVAAMRSTAKVFLGTHDFRAFCATGGEEKEDTVRTVTRLDVIGRGRKLRIVAEADGFLYKMVRSLAGTLVAVGLGKLTVADVRRLLAGKKRTAAVDTAPACGLFLWQVFYRKR